MSLDISKDQQQCELVDYFDKNNLLISTGNKRNSLIPKDLYRKIVCCIIITKDKKVLLTKRSKFKKYHPSVYEFTSGGLQSKEDIYSGIIREVKEETGVIFNKECDSLIHVYTAINKKNQTIYEGFVLKLNSFRPKITLQKYETEQYQFVSLSKLLKRMSYKDFAPNLYQSYKVHLVDYKKIYKKLL